MLSERELARLSPRQRFRLARQKELILQRDALTGLDLGIETGLSGTQLYRAGVDLIVGVDTHQPHVDVARLPGTVYDIAVCQDAFDFLEECSFEWDVVVCAELLGHYPKENGLWLLENLERESYVILTTPIGNPHQEHKSGWTADELSDRGWSIHCESEEHCLIVATWG